MFEVIVSLAALTLMEIVLGIDNIVFIAIVANSLPERLAAKARIIGLSVALLARVGLLMILSWIIGLTKPLFTLFEQNYSLRDLILLGGGLFLIAKATQEIHDKMEGAKDEHGQPKKVTTLSSAIAQIVLIDVIFSLDSVMTAVGMVKELWMMITAVVIAIIVMILFAGYVSDFIKRHPSLKILALSFLILIGVMLVADGLGQHIDRGYIYFAMFFSLFVELIKMRVRN